MKKKILIGYMIFMLWSFFLSVYANTLKLNIVSSQEKVKIGQEFEITVDWQDKMQAADFILKYDSEKIRFVESDISENYIKQNEDEILVVWFSNDNVELSNMKFKFEAITEGNIRFESQVSGGFATGDLEIPDRFEDGSLEIEIVKNSFIMKYLLIALIVILFIKLINIKNKGIKQRRKRK